MAEVCSDAGRIRTNVIDTPVLLCYLLAAFGSGDNQVKTPRQKIKKCPHIFTEAHHSLIFHFLAQFLLCIVTLSLNLFLRVKYHLVTVFFFYSSSFISNCKFLVIFLTFYTPYYSLASCNVSSHLSFRLTLPKIYLVFSCHSLLFTPYLLIPHLTLLLSLLSLLTRFILLFLPSFFHISLITRSLYSSPFPYFL